LPHHAANGHPRRRGVFLLVLADTHLLGSQPPPLVKGIPGQPAMAIPNSFDILQAVIEATPDAIFVKDLEGRYVLVNAAAARFLDRSPDEIVGKHDLELYPEETARRFIEDDRKVLREGRPLVFEGVAQSAVGTQAYLVTKGVYRDQTGQIQGLFGISHDITDLRRAQATLEQTREALFRSQKMETVGQLTGGLAHDFNNLLAVILGNLELLRIHLKSDAHANDLIDAVTRAALHGQDLTASLLAFARRRQLNPEPIDINALIGTVVRLMSRTLARIRIITDLSDRARIALVDVAALESAILNIVLNARDAMPDGGTVRIRTFRAELSAPRATDDDPAPGTYAIVSIEDTGAGMPPEVMARVFEPFFTTKAASGGTGLGLSMVYGFAKQSGGTVSIASAPGRGTTVQLFLPVGATGSRPEAPRGRAVDEAVVARTILVVEDESEVRTTVRRQLESVGHRVLVAESAADALDIVRTTPTLDVMLSDVVLGDGLNGIDLAIAARAVRPRLRVAFISGFSAVPEAQRKIRDLGALLLGKPASIPQLASAIDSICAR
jgi:PAS domain S-box-containing protein